MIYMRGKKVLIVSKMAKKSRFKLVMLCTEGSKKRWGGGLRAQFFRHPIGDYRHLLKISLKKLATPWKKSWNRHWINQLIYQPSVVSIYQSIYQSINPLSNHSICPASFNQLFSQSTINQPLLTLVFLQSESVDILLLTKYLSISCRRTMKGVPGVMQLESNLSSVGRLSPRSRAFFSFCSASLADRNLSYRLTTTCRGVRGQQIPIEEVEVNNYLQRRWRSTNTYRGGRGQQLPVEEVEVNNY